MKLALAYIACALFAVIGALFIFGPYEDATLDMGFASSQLDGGIDAYLAAQEARAGTIRPGTQKRMVWAGAPEAKAPWSVVYIHGFSATSEEIRPVPDRVAEALGANLFFTRLTGHGQDGGALAEATVRDWSHDLAEAMEIGHRTGDKVLVIATSTGATLATYAATTLFDQDRLAGAVLISPNYAIKNSAARLLTWPAARYWVGAVAGETIGFTPLNDAHGQYWTTEYPTVATLPMAALVERVNRLDLSTITAPALFIYSDADKVVSPAATASVIAQWGSGWGTRTEVWQPTLGLDDDPYAHVIAGDILSPGQTDPAVQRIVAFAQSL